MRIMSRKWMPMVAIALSAVMSTVSADAQELEAIEVVSAPGSFNIIPAEYSYSDEPVMVISDFSSENNSTAITTLDSSLNEGMNVSVENTAYYFKRYYEEAQLVGQGYFILPDMFKAGTNVNQKLGKAYMTKEEATDYVANVAPRSIAEFRSMDYIIYFEGITRTDKYDYKQKDYDGDIYWYPNQYCSWDDYHNGVDIDRAVYDVSYMSDGLFLGSRDFYYFRLDKDGQLMQLTERNEMKYEGDWKYSGQEPMSDGVKYSTNAVLNIYRDAKSASYNDVVYTQTLFNDDEELEYVEFKYRKDPTNMVTTWKKDWEYDQAFGSYENRKYGYTEEVMIADGVEIRNTKNHTIATMTIPAEYSISTSQPVRVLDLVSHRYLILTLNKEKDIYYQIFEINRAASSVQQVGSPMRARIIPTVVSQGEDVMVEVPEEYDTTTVSVTSMNGKTEHVERMAEGGGRTSIATGKLSRGVHVVSLCEDGKHSVEATKIVVK